MCECVVVPVCPEDVSRNLFKIAMSQQQQQQPQQNGVATKIDTKWFVFSTILFFSIRFNAYPLAERCENVIMCGRNTFIRFGAIFDRSTSYAATIMIMNHVYRSELRTHRQHRCERINELHVLVIVYTKWGAYGTHIERATKLLRKIELCVCVRALKSSLVGVHVKLLASYLHKLNVAKDTASGIELNFNVYARIFQLSLASMALYRILFIIFWQLKSAKSCRTSHCNIWKH